MSSPPAGWYPDESGNGANYWNGERWTAHSDSLPASVPPPGARPLSLSRTRTTPGGISGFYFAALLCAGAVIVGSVSPWGSTAYTSANGTSITRGVIVLLAAIFAVVALLVSEGVRENPSRVISAVVAVLGLVIVAIGVYTYIRVTNMTTPYLGHEVRYENPAWGLDLTILGGVGLVVTGWLLRR